MIKFKNKIDNILQVNNSMSLKIKTKENKSKTKPVIKTSPKKVKNISTENNNNSKINKSKQKSELESEVEIKSDTYSETESVIKTKTKKPVKSKKISPKIKTKEKTKTTQNKVVKVKAKVETESESELDSDLEIISDTEGILDNEPDVNEEILKVDPKNSLEIKTTKSGSIRILFDVIKNLLLKSDTNLIFTPESIKIFQSNGRDTARIQLVLLAIEFELYHCEGTIRVGINCEEINKIIKTGDPKVENISFIVVRDKIESFIIKFENKEESNIREHILINRDVPYIKENIPITTFASEMIMPSQKFQRRINSLNKMGTGLKCKITFTGQKMEFEVIEGLNVHKSYLGKNDSYTFKHGKDEIVQGTFSLTFLDLFAKASGLDKWVKIYLKNDFPLILEYSVGNLGFLRCIIVPENNISLPIYNKQLIEAVQIPEINVNDINNSARYLSDDNADSDSDFY